MSGPGMQQKLPDYESPPLIEVVFGVAFEPLKGFMVPHIGAYWERIRETYPGVDCVPPLPPVPLVSEVWQFPLPRTWFISTDRSHLIQLQNGRFLLNWRLQDNGQVYPRYGQMKPRFLESFAGFSSFVRDFGLGDVTATSLELSYVNHIHYSELAASVASVGAILRDVGWEAPGARFLPEPTGLAWKGVFALPDGRGNLTVDLKHGSKLPQGLSLFILQLTASGPVGGPELGGMDAWLDVAHEWIVRGFADVTTAEAQGHLWKRIAPLGADESR